MLLREPAGALHLKHPSEYQPTTSTDSGIQAEYGVQVWSTANIERRWLAPAGFPFPDQRVKQGNTAGVTTLWVAVLSAYSGPGTTL